MTGNRPLPIPEILGTPGERVRCPRCGAQMTRLGEMVDCAAGLATPWPVDADLGGVLREVHQCPNCGNVVTRRAT